MTGGRHPAPHGKETRIRRLTLRPYHGIPEDIAPQDEATIPDAWDEGEEETSRTSSEEVWTTANEESTAGEEDDDSLPELVSGSEDSGYEFLNTPTNQEKEFNDTANTYTKGRNNNIHRKHQN